MNQKIAQIHYPEQLRALLNWSSYPKTKTLSTELPKASLADWLRVHQLAVDECMQALEVAAWLVPAQAANCEPPPNTRLSADDAWQLVFLAFTSSYSALKSDAGTVYNNAPRCLLANSDKYSMPFTYDLGKGLCPFVSTHFQGSYHDLLCLAHEFGHAVQIVAFNSDKNMPPVTRECCAFLGELSLLRYARLYAQSLAADLAATWNHNSCTYLGSYSKLLAEGLGNADKRYDYRWNYPLARLVALQLYENHGKRGFDVALEQNLNLSGILRSCYRKHCP